VAQEARTGTLAMPRVAAHAGSARQDGFVGRVGESAALAELVGDWSGGPAVVAVVSGQPGVGKTSFAVRAASELAGDFDDGQFFIDLRGLDERPTEPSVVLEWLIRELAPDQRLVPPAMPARAALYREILADRRAVIVLDNAADEAQVGPLLPAEGPSLVLVTSRGLLAGMGGVHRLPLGPFPEADADSLLRALAPSGADVDGVGARCGNLPLALCLAAPRLTAAGKPPANQDPVAAAFGVSYELLPEGSRRLLRRLALLPGPDTGPDLAAALADLTVPETRRALDELVRLGLIESGFVGRYRPHDEIGSLAAARAEREEATAGGEEVAQRAIDWLLDTAIVAGRWFEPAHGALAPDWDGRVPLDTPALAEDWLRAEADNWFAALRASAARGDHQRVVDVAESMHWFSDRWIHWGRWTEVFTLSSAAGRALGDPTAEATHLNYLSWALNVCSGDTPGAVLKAEEAFAVAGGAGNVSQRGWARFYLSWARMDLLEDWDGALAAAEEGVELFRLAGDREGLAQGLASVARCFERVGRFDEALDAFGRLLVVLTDPATAPAEPVATFTRALTSYRMGRTYATLERWPAAAGVLTTAESLTERAGHSGLHSWTLAALGEALCQLDRPAEGVARLRRALAIHTELKDAGRMASTQALIDKYSSGG
jgi:tetratricopeptide (TPR) repeat protein